MLTGSGLSETQPNSSGSGWNNADITTQFNQPFPNVFGSFNSTPSPFELTPQMMFGRDAPRPTPVYSIIPPTIAHQHALEEFDFSFSDDSPHWSCNNIFASRHPSSSGYQNKSTGFGFSSRANGSSFSQNQQSASSGLQDASWAQSLTNSGIFGTDPKKGTLMKKYEPTSSIDTIQDYTAYPIKIKYQCITLMEEYELKSFEELRLEDYQYNRIGLHHHRIFGNVCNTNTQYSSGTAGNPTTVGFHTAQGESGFEPLTDTCVFSIFKPTSDIQVRGRDIQMPIFRPRYQQQMTGFNSTPGKQPTELTSVTRAMYDHLLNMNLAQQQQQQQQQQHVSAWNRSENRTEELRNLIQNTDPLGYNKHLEGLSPIQPNKATYITNPTDLQKTLESPHLCVVSPKAKRLPVFPISPKKDALLDALIDKKLKSRTSAKRSVLNKKPPLDNQDVTPQGSELDINDSVNNNLLNKEQEQAQYSISSLGRTTTAHYNVQTQADEDDDEINACGVKLSGRDYYTIPPLQKLIEYKQPDGRCLVKGFTVGRVGYGNVCFPDEIDVSGLDLDELVHFKYRELTIYPDDSQKPPQGSGLNRRAQITLDRVYPRSTTDLKLIKDMDDVTLVTFIASLEFLCEKHKTKFIDYRGDTGSWVFMVDHFSRFAFEESDSEGDRDVGSSSKKVEKKDLGEKKNGQKKSDDKLKDKEDKLKDKEDKHKDKEDKLTQKEDKTHKGDQLYHQEDKLYLEQDKLDHREDELMQERLVNLEIMMAHQYTEHMERAAMIPVGEMFDDEMGMGDVSLGLPGASIENLDYDDSHLLSPSNIHHVYSRGDLYQPSLNKIYFMKNSLYDNFKSLSDEKQTIETILSETSLFKGYEVPMEDLDEDMQQVILKPSYTLQNNKCIFADERLYNERSYVDITVFKGASFKVGWSRGMVITTPSISIVSDSSPSNLADQVNHAVRIVKVTDVQKFDPFTDKLELHLQVVLDTSDITMQPNNIPLFTIRPGKTALLRHQLLARETAKDNVENMATIYYQQIWDLCAVFWGPMLPPTNRRDLFSTWLENTIEATIEDELNSLKFYRSSEDSLYLQMFINLTGNRITEAAALAGNAGLYNLSLLISELNSSKQIKMFMGDQQEYWRFSSFFEHIHPTLQKIYMLIAGRTVGGFSKQFPRLPVNVCENLDWNRCLAIVLWYVASSGDSISAALGIYTYDFEKAGFSIKPKPPFYNQENIYDLIYHLMMLFCAKGKPLETILEPETHSAISSDYRLSWLLLHMLQSLQVGSIGNTAKTFITTSFARQLEDMGLYKWAVFVLLFIEEIDIKKNSIMGVLYRNLEQDDRDRLIEDDIVTELCVPSAWIHEVKAYRSNILSMHWEAYKHFTYEGNWAKSHEVALKHVIPYLIVNDQLDTVGYVLRDIEQGCRNIFNWLKEGGLILMFLDIYEKFQEKQKFSKEEALSIHSLLIRVCYGLTEFPLTSAVQVAATSDISKYCNLYKKLLISQIDSTRKERMEIVCTQLDSLIMPPDYKIDDLQGDWTSEESTDDDDDAISVVSYADSGVN